MMDWDNNVVGIMRRLMMRKRRWWTEEAIDIVDGKPRKVFAENGKSFLVSVFQRRRVKMEGEFSYR